MSPQRRENRGRAPPSRTDEIRPIITKIASLLVMNLNIEKNGIYFQDSLCLSVQLACKDYFVYKIYCDTGFTSIIYILHLNIKTAGIKAIKDGNQSFATNIYVNMRINRLPILSSILVYFQNLIEMINRISAIIIVFLILPVFTLCQVQTNQTKQQDVQNSTNATAAQIPISEDIVLSYTLTKNQTIVYYRLNSKNASQITIFLNELAGHVQIKVLNQNDKPIGCMNNSQNSYKCTFIPQKDTNYRIMITGDANKEDKFTISYTTDKAQCFLSKLNQPIFVNLIAKSNECFTFDTKRDISMLLKSAFTHIQLLEQQIDTNISINQLYFDSTKNYHKEITDEDIQRLCPNSTIACSITINFQNKINSTNYFSFVLQEKDAEIALFDGISQQIKEQISQDSKPKYFYYSLSNDKLIQIFFTSESFGHTYFLAAKFVSNQTFFTRSNNDNIYAPYIPQADRSSAPSLKDNNSLWKILGKESMQRFGIDSGETKQNCPLLNCFLILSIYPETTSQSNIREYQYQIEVSQQQTYLQLGQSKIGMLNKNEYYTYLVDPHDAIIQFRSLHASGKNKVCVSVQAALSNSIIVKGSQFKGDLQVAKDQKIQKIFVKGQKQLCSYQIKYISNKNPYQIVHLSHPYEVNLQKEGILKLIYYHQSIKTFKVVQMSCVGSLKMYIMPIKQNNFTLSSLNTLNFSTFPSFQLQEGEYYIQENHTNYCQSCYYYIVATTETKFVGEIVFLKYDDPIPLSTMHILKEKLHPPILMQYQDYIYYSLATFVITFNMLSGSIHVLIIDPNNVTVVNETIKQKKAFTVKSLQYKQKEKIQFYSDKAKFKIKTTAIPQAQFYIEINRKQLTQRIFQGYPLDIFIDNYMAQSIEFINSQDLQTPLNLMIEIKGQYKDSIMLNFTVTGIKLNGGLIQSKQIIRNITKSDNSYLITMNNFKARYFLAITTNNYFNATVLLVKASQTYLLPASNYLFNHQGTYSISTNSKSSLVEIYHCQGELIVTGGKQKVDSRKEISNDIELKAPNYGGHYVLSIKSNISSYALKIKSKGKKSKSEYLISYNQGPNYYQAIDVQNYQIDYKLNDKSMTINVQQPVLIKANVELNITEVSYYLYASTSKVQVNRYARCSIKGNNSLLIISKTASILIENNKLNELVGNQTKDVFIQVQATVKIKKQVNSSEPQILTFLYNTIKVPITIQKQSTSSSQLQTSFDSLLTFLGQFLAIFFIFLGLPYLLFLACKKRYASRNKKMNEETQSEGQNQTKGSEKQIIASSGVIPDSAGHINKDIL